MNNKNMNILIEKINEIKNIFDAIEIELKKILDFPSKREKLNNKIAELQLKNKKGSAKEIDKHKENYDKVILNWKESYGIARNNIKNKCKEFYEKFLKSDSNRALSEKEIITLILDNIHDTFVNFNDDCDIIKEVLDTLREANTSIAGFDRKQNIERLHKGNPTANILDIVNEPQVKIKKLRERSCEVNKKLSAKIEESAKEMSACPELVNAKSKLVENFEKNVKSVDTTGSPNTRDLKDLKNKSSKKSSSITSGNSNNSLDTSLNKDSSHVVNNEIEDRSSSAGSIKSVREMVSSYEKNDNGQRLSSNSKSSIHSIEGKYANELDESDKEDCGIPESQINFHEAQNLPDKEDCGIPESQINFHEAQNLPIEKESRKLEFNEIDVIQESPSVVEEIFNYKGIAINDGGVYNRESFEKQGDIFNIQVSPTEVSPTASAKNVSESNTHDLNESVNNLEQHVVQELNNTLNQEVTKDFSGNSDNVNSVIDNVEDVVQELNNTLNAEVDSDSHDFNRENHKVSYFDSLNEIVKNKPKSPSPPMRSNSKSSDVNEDGGVDDFPCNEAIDIEEHNTCGTFQNNNIDDYAVSANPVEICAGISNGNIHNMSKDVNNDSSLDQGDVYLNNFDARRDQNDIADTDELPPTDFTVEDVQKKPGLMNNVKNLFS